MNKTIALLAAGLAAAALTAAADKPDGKVQEKDEIRQTLHFADPARPGDVIVDNVWSSIEVEGADVREVELVARKTIRAKSEDRLARAKDEVKLEIRENAPDIEIFVDGPFRCNDLCEPVILGTIGSCHNKFPCQA